jgi:N-acetylglucosaminyldiphosphoundecaprenol N-acetyl-beta-D-mannosaminyltransferase
MPVHRVTRAQALELIRGYVADRIPRIVVTADASAHSIGMRDPVYRAIVRDADLVTPDGSGLLWAARRLGMPLVERVSGVDLAEDLCRLSGEWGSTLFFYGGAPGVADEAATAMRRRYPNLQVAGTAHGFLGEGEQAELRRRIRELRPDILLVAMGIPRQEKWIHAHRGELGVPVSMGIGGSFDVFSGRVRRAPVWMQRRGLEWLFRLSQDPRKLAKVATLPHFVVNVLLRRSWPA